MGRRISYGGILMKGLKGSHVNLRRSVTRWNQVATERPL